MTATWPKVRLGEVVAPVARADSPQPGTTYRQIGVKLWGEGAVSDRHFRVRAGEK